MENFSMTFAENRTYGVPEFAGTEVNRHSSKLKGLSGYLQNHYPIPAPLQPHNTPQYHQDTMVGDKNPQYHHDTMIGDKTQQYIF